MINLYNQVPTVYNKASRDFQYMSWLINIVLNSVKHNVDDLYNLPIQKNDPRLTELLAMTLGFKPKRKYDKDQLAAIVGILPSILKYKGTKKAIIIAIEALIKSSGVAGDFNADSSQFFSINDRHVEITLPKNLIDVSLLTDLFQYILPAGMTYRINRKTQYITNPSTELVHDSIPIAQIGYDIGGLDDSSGLSKMFKLGKQPDFTYIDEKNSASINSGLLSNTIVPTLSAKPVSNSAEPDYTTEKNDYGTTVVINKYSEDGDTVTIG